LAPPLMVLLRGDGGARVENGKIETVRGATWGATRKFSAGL